jgi:SAM-dependent methyltransferase
VFRNFVLPAGSRGPNVLAERRDPRPEHAALIRDVSEQIRPDDVSLSDWYERYRKQQGRRLAFDLGIIEQHVPCGQRLADLGSMPPLLGAALARLGHDVVLVDHLPERFGSSSAALGLRCEKCDIEREALPFESESIDAIVLHEVFEHLRIDLVHCMQEIARVLRPGALLLLSTPNLTSARGLFNLAFRGRAESLSADPFVAFSKLRELGHMGHVREYTTVEVCEFVERFGLRPQTLVFRGGRTPVTKMVPRLRPIFEVIARKDASAPVA